MLYSELTPPYALTLSVSPSCWGFHSGNGVHISGYQVLVLESFLKHIGLARSAFPKNFTRIALGGVVDRIMAPQRCPKPWKPVNILPYMTKGTL